MAVRATVRPLPVRRWHGGVPRWAKALSSRSPEDRVAVRQSDPDVVRHDTGAFGSAGTVVAGKAVLLAATSLAERLRTLAARHTGTARHLCVVGAESVDCAVRLVTLKELYEAGHSLGAAEELAADGHWGGSPRSVAFNAQWFRIAVDPATGEIRILRSVHAADAGKVMNPRVPVRPFLQTVSHSPWVLPQTCCR